MQRRVRLALIGMLAALAACGFCSSAAQAVILPPTLSMTFGGATDTTMPFGTTVRLAFAIGNPNTLSDITSLAFNVSLQPGFVVASPSAVTETCDTDGPATVTADPGTASVSLSNGSVGPRSVCEVAMNVTAIWASAADYFAQVSSSNGPSDTVKSGVTVQQAPATDRVYWSSVADQTISYRNLDGSGAGDIDTGAATVNQPDGLAIDATQGRIYWANYSGNKISWAALDGSGGGDLPTGSATVNGPEGLAIDVSAGRVYWGNSAANKISYARLDGGGGGDLATGAATLDQPEGVALDPTAGRIYWANNGGNKISWANLDGTGGGDLNTGSATLFGPIGVAIDQAQGRIYWSNYSGGTISFADLSGGAGGDLATTAGVVNGPAGVAIDPGTGLIFWANNNYSLGFAHLDGSGDGTVSVPRPHNEFPTLLRAPAGAGVPTITGAATPGSTLSCSQGTWAPDLVWSSLYRAPASFAYQWSAGGSDIPGATTNSLTAAAAGTYSCRVSVANFAGGASQTSAPFTVATPPTMGPSPSGGAKPPTLSQLSETNSVFAPAPGSTPRTGATSALHKRGTVFSFALDQAATVSIQIERTRPGRVVGGRCVRSTKSLRRHRRCTLALELARLTRTAHAGVNKVVFSGRVARKALGRGHYAAVFTPTAGTARGASRSLGFTIVAR